MFIRRTIFIFLLAVLSATNGAADEKQGDGPRAVPSAQEITDALAEAADSPGSLFHLQANCTDQKGNRGFNLFPGGVTLWNGRSQLSVPSASRSALLKILLDRGFAEFEASYGGSVRVEKKAPARIICRVWLKIGELWKTSVQRGGGQQSAALMGLASELLDQVEPFVEGGVTPDSLQNGLEKLASGDLSIEALSLRFVEIPPRDYIRQGSIIRLRGGKVSRQHYKPGKAIAEQTREPLPTGKYQALIKALLAAEPGSLPNNLWSEDQLEFEIQILGHKKAVLARPFKRLESAVQGPEQQRFDQLLPTLRELAH